jgi:para-nitrobenzyl esterase
MLAAALVFSQATTASPVIIDTGRLEGTTTHGLVIYKGVPFAAPPVGELRWREPQPVQPWKGIRSANEFAPACMQNTVSMPGEAPPPTDEDCLYLNIWAPASGGRSLPVFVWIYGGGYNSGSASMPLYWGDQLARRGVIVVTIAYRVGPLGYLAHPSLTQESSHHTSGNYGLMDQIAALQWVQTNIHAFGGDRRRVTIAGQSAGSMAVSMLMASPRAKGLFQRAIGQSGGLFEPLQLAPFYLLANAEHDGEQYAATLGAKSIEDLRRLPAKDLMTGAAGHITHPVIEPYTLPASPYDVFTNGRQNDVPLLLGSNAEEARALVDVSSVRAATFESELHDAFGPVISPEAMAAYPHRTDEEAKAARLDIERDIRFGWDMWCWARLQAVTGREPVYYYYFTQKPPFPANSTYAAWGASHYAELWYMFDHLSQEPWQWTAADKRLADEMTTYWVNFVRTGNPNSSNLPEWTPYTRAHPSVAYLGTPITFGPRDHIEQLQAIDAAYEGLRKSPYPKLGTRNSVSVCTAGTRITCAASSMSSASKRSVVANGTRVRSTSSACCSEGDVFRGLRKSSP